MKFCLLLSLFLSCSAMLYAQETQPAKKPVRIETEHEHKGASHTHTRTAVAPTEHRSTASWHYHRGPKRTQVQVDGAGAADSVKK